MILKLFINFKSKPYFFRFIIRSHFLKRRIILFLCFIISVNFIFARDMLVEIKEALQETGLYVFSKEDAKKEQKPFVDISYMPKEKFVKMYTTPWIRKDIFSDSNNITYEDIIKFFKNGVKIDSTAEYGLQYRFDKMLDVG